MRYGTVARQVPLEQAQDPLEQSSLNALRLPQLTVSDATMSPRHYTGIENHIRKTPRIRLRKLSELTGCEILGKAEFMNPGGSVKDRAALGIILDAESEGRLGLATRSLKGLQGILASASLLSGMQRAIAQ